MKIPKGGQSETVYQKEQTKEKGRHAMVKHCTENYRFNNTHN